MFNFLFRPIYKIEPPLMGLDISDLSIKMMRLDLEKKRNKIIAFGETSIPSGIIENGILKKPEELALIIKEITKKTLGGGAKNMHVVASLPEQETFLRVVKLSDIDEPDVEKMVYSEIESTIPISASDLYIDWQVVQRSGPTSPSQGGPPHTTTEVLFVAIAKDVANSYIDAIKKSGLRIKALELESQALARSIIPNAYPATALIVDFGTTSIGFSIISNHIIEFTSTIHLGGRDLEKAIVDDLKVSGDEAKRLKIEVGMDRSRENGSVYEALKPAIDNALQQIQDYISYFSDHGGKKENGETRTIEKIFLSGGDSNLIGLPSYMSLKLKIPTEIANPLVNIIGKDSSEIPVISHKISLAYAVAIGLALRKEKNT